MKVPDVAGMKYTTAVNTLVEKGFEVTEPNIVYTDDVEVGDVIKRIPVAGRVVKKTLKLLSINQVEKRKVRWQISQVKTLRV